MAAFIIMIRWLFGKPSAPPAPMVGPVTAAIRAMREAAWIDRADSLRRDLETATPDDREAAYLPALRELIRESAELAGVNP